MTDYWVTFRIANDSGYEDRYQSLLENINIAKGGNKSWSETTSFWLITSELAIDAFVARITKDLNPRKDLLVCRCLSKNVSRCFGAVDQVDLLKEFLPSIKKLG